MTEPVMPISLLVANTESLTNALLVGFDAGLHGDIDSLPSDASPEWAEYYHRGYVEGEAQRHSETLGEGRGHDTAA